MWLLPAGSGCEGWYIGCPDRATWAIGLGPSMGIEVSRCRTSGRAAAVRGPEVAAVLLGDRHDEELRAEARSRGSARDRREPLDLRAA